MKQAVGIGITVVALLSAAVLLIPAFIDLGAFKSTFLPSIEEALHRRVDVGEVRLSLIPTPSIRLSNLRVFDSPAFPGNTFFGAQHVQLRLRLWPLLRGRYEVTEFVLEKPVINLLRQPDGTFNYSDLAGKKTSSAPRGEPRKKAAGSKSQEAAGLPLWVPNRMRIKDGQLSLETEGQKPLRINGIDLSLQDFSNDQFFPYRAAFEYPGLKTVSLEGRLSYHEEQATLKLKDNRLKVRDLVLPVEGSLSSLSTVPRVNLSLASDRVDAKQFFQILSVFGLAPKETEISGPMGLRLSVNGLSHSLVTQLRGQFKDVKVDGKRAIKGNLNGEVLLRLPLGGATAVSERLQGDGRLVARDGELTNVDLINKIQRVTGMVGLSPDERRQATTFKTLETEFTLGGGIANFKRIFLVNPQMEVNGAGTMTLEKPRLNMGIEATLSPQATARSGQGKTMTLLKDSQGRIVVPLRITGRAEDPSVSLDGEKMAQRGLGKETGTFFKQLFRRK